MKYGEKRQATDISTHSDLSVRWVQIPLLINKSGSTDNVIEVDTKKDTIVYTFDVSNKMKVEESASS